MARFDQQFRPAQFSQPGSLYRGQGNSKSQQIKIYRESISAYLRYWGFEIGVQVLLDSLGITQLTEENYHLAMIEVCKKGLEKLYDTEKESETLQ